MGKVAFGLAGMAGSPITGAQDVGSDIVTQATGNPEAGSRAAALPFGGIPIAKGTQSVKAAIPSNKAFSILVDKIGTENIPEIVSRMEANPRLSVMDVSNPALQAGQKLQVIPGPQQDKLARFVDASKKEAKGAVTQSIDDAMGKPVNVKEKLDEIPKIAASKVGKEQINPALAEASPANVSGVIAHIDFEAKAGRPSRRWSMDFIFDSTSDKRKLKCLNVVDDCTREALAIKVARLIPALGVCQVLDHLVARYGKPEVC